MNDTIKKPIALLCNKILEQASLINPNALPDAVKNLEKDVTEDGIKEIIKLIEQELLKAGEDEGSYTATNLITLNKILTTMRGLLLDQDDYTNALKKNRKIIRTYSYLRGMGDYTDTGIIKARLTTEKLDD